MIYTIKSGNHYANGNNFGFHSNGKTVSKTVIFYQNCKYDLGNENQKDINKLYGFSVGLFSGNQYNSARFGWRWDVIKNKIELMAYVYVNGHRINEWEEDLILGDASLDSEIFTSLSIFNNSYSFKVIIDGSTIVKVFPRSGDGIGYNQYPYFGGNQPAPHEMTIYLK